MSPAPINTGSPLGCAGCAYPGPGWLINNRITITATRFMRTTRTPRSSEDTVNSNRYLWQRQHADALAALERLLGRVLVALRIAVTFHGLTINVSYPHFGHACQGVPW